jgi:cysteate synthase
MVSAWNAGRNYIDHEIDIPKIDNILDVVAARVLSTKYPAYGVRGGVYDALRATNGMMYGITNDEVYESKELFKRTEGPDILPASCVALTSLKKAIKEKRVRKDDCILLNLTGAGTEQRLRDLFILQMKPAVEVTKDITDDQIRELNV